ncbi:hypothetical protein VSY18_27990 (plasmid) [Bacillus albus]|uniref:hypothetical protein n=1 Tax=Bacillus cereus group TaxID=86661 RepID=UPI0022E29E42|nr:MULTISPECIES: hypothetical protein [Bacillus cereus group]MDA2029866.1 hypothetical protein [Bacillus cereus group sp. Bcc03]MDA2219779.1 hypothetical protein [Bacillus cereus group sp. Bc228]MDA2231325.1 hypothetical protein [Bacillus cereus group sp. Bc227]MDA2264115.1 hypothetical protein [Bacillus cereus group sp. Bc200]MDA2324021.1 hypothetical protein [Bacillus cereus group sp. Bc177]
MTNPIENKHQDDNQLQSQIINQIIPILEKLVMQFIQNPAPNEDMMPGNDNKFMEIDDVVDNLVNAGMITANNFNVNVELFRGSPITVSIVKAGDPAVEVPVEGDAGDSIEGHIDETDNKEGTK